jgi:hypothetical protein
MILFALLAERIFVIQLKYSISKQNPSLIRLIIYEHHYRRGKRLGMRKRVIITLVIVIFGGSCIGISTFGSAILQEENPIRLMVSAMKLQLSDSEYVQFAKTEKRSRYLSLNTDQNRYEMVKEYMKSKGWMFHEQMGAGLIFTKNGEDAVVEIRQYSRHYFIWEIQKAFIQ